MKKLIMLLILASCLIGCEYETSELSEQNAIYLNYYITDDIYHLVFQKEDGDYVSLRVEYGDEGLINLLEDGSHYNISYYISQYSSLKTFTLRNIEASNKSDI